MIECNVCHSKLASPTTIGVSRAYDRHKSSVSSKQRALKVFLVIGDCVLVGFQPILVYMSKVDGRFMFIPIGINFLTEVARFYLQLLCLSYRLDIRRLVESPFCQFPHSCRQLRTMFFLLLQRFYAILKKYSSTVATIFTGIASAAPFGHTLTVNFILGISLVFISMHQFFSPLCNVKDEEHNGKLELVDYQDNHRSKESFINMAAGANEEAGHHVGPMRKNRFFPF